MEGLTMRNCEGTMATVGYAMDREERPSGFDAESIWKMYDSFSEEEKKQWF